jgi:hypothetical protein
MELSDATARRLFDELQQMETRLSERIAGRCDGLELRIGERCDEPHTHFTSRCDGIQQQVASLFDSFNGTATSSATAPRYDDVFGSSTGTAYDDAFATSASAAAPSPSYDDDEPVFDAWPIFDEESIDSTASQALFSDGADHCFGDELDTGRTMEFCYNDDNHIGVDVDIDILPTFEFDIKQTVVVASSTKDSLELTGADQRSSNPGHSTSTMDAMMQLLLDEMALMEARITDVIEGRSSLSDTEATVGSRARNIPDSVVADLAVDHLFGGAFGLDNLTPMAAQAPSAEEVPQPQAEVVASSKSEPATYAELVAAPTKCSTIDLNRGIYSVPNPVLHRQHLLRDCDGNHVGVDVDILPTSEFDEGPIFDEEPCFHRSLLDSDPDSPYDWVVPVPSSPCDDERIIALSSDCTATNSLCVGSVTDSGSE